MARSNILSSLLLVLLTIAIILNFKRKYIGKELPLPPSPPADPIIGHIRSMPRLYPWRTFSEWGSRWGGLIYVHVLGKPMIIINDLAIARELLDKRGSIYSDRPRYVLFCEMMGWDNTLAFIPYGDKFRKHRKMIQQHFNSQAVLRFRALQHSEIYVLLLNLLQTPEDFDCHIKRAVAATLLGVTYGHQVTSNDDEYVTLIEKAVALTVAPGAPGNTLPDFLPFLRHVPKWLPGAGLQHHAMKTRKLVDTVLDAPYELVKQRRALGMARPSFISFLLDEYEHAGGADLGHENDIKGVGAVIYAAGFETSQSTLLTFVLAMTRHPEIMKRAQEEIDRTLGRDRMPTLDDRDSLPYVDCILKECLRWNTPAPLAIPHRILGDDNYCGMFIPKGATIFPNIWGMMRDERIYLNADQFCPDRFSHSSDFNYNEKGLEEEDYNPLNVVFGFGRRICPGRFLAENSLWLTIASVLAAFDILRPLDSDGNEYTPEVAFTTGTTSQPKDFRCRFVPRGQKYEEMIKQEQAAY